MPRATSKALAWAAVSSTASALKLGQKATAAVRSYGPQHCVSVSRNAKSGTCVLSTRCDGVNLDAVEFAFTCRKPGVLQKHSFGKGGFAAEEEFDTAVQCDVCDLPPEVNQSLDAVAKASRALAPEAEKAKAISIAETAPRVMFSVANASSQVLPTSEKKTAASAATKVKETPSQEAPPAPVYQKVDNPIVEGKSPPHLGGQAQVPAPLGTRANVAELEANLPVLQERGVELASFGDTAHVSYGPGNCIQTWLQKDNTGSSGSAGEEVTTTDGAKGVVVPDGEKGVCIIKTDCGVVDQLAFQAYPIGLIATDKNGVPVRHLFGPNSFDRVEEFNTLIRASSCFGLDETSEAVTLEGEIKALSKTITTMQRKVDELTSEQSETSAKLLEEDRQIKLVEASRKKEQEDVEQSRRERRTAQDRRIERVEEADRRRVDEKVERRDRADDVQEEEEEDDEEYERRAEEERLRDEDEEAAYRKSSRGDDRED
ncbi:unnamed protein product [Amoebophrya sp. A25]|nr:unnamed protein product [Amoebophrya sp. A25]|eukprot:GSA25T00004344001.1